MGSYISPALFDPLKSTVSGSFDDWAGVEETDDSPDPDENNLKATPAPKTQLRKSSVRTILPRVVSIEC
jgi:hypothetical protein